MRRPHAGKAAVWAVVVAGAPDLGDSVEVVARVGGHWERRRIPTTPFRHLGLSEVTVGAGDRQIALPDAIEYRL